MKFRLSSLRLFRRRGKADTNDDDDDEGYYNDGNGVPEMVVEDDESDDNLRKARRKDPGAGTETPRKPRIGIGGKKYRQFGGSVPAFAFYNQHGQPQHTDQDEKGGRGGDGRNKMRGHFSHKSAVGAASSTHDLHNNARHDFDTDAMPTARYHRPSAVSADILAQLPAPVLRRVFEFVCPHSRDETYETQEQSSVGDGCALCDLRDLAHCLVVCRRWRREGVLVLYHSIRVDNVHYCPRETPLSERRKRRTLFDRNGESEDPSTARLRLLCRTLRDDPTRLGVLVQYLKLPYMLRESQQVDLARTISVLPNLRYVDLPEALYADDAGCATLRLEVEARCRELRKMAYVQGSERSLEHLGAGVWENLEVLELVRIQIDPTVLLHVLGRLRNLRAVKITESEVISDEVLAHQGLDPPVFPALEELILEKVASISAAGLGVYLSRPDVAGRLKVLTLNRTGVRPWHLHQVLQAGLGLERLSIAESVAQSMTSAAGAMQIPLLASTSLRTLHYEMSLSASSQGYAHILASYYQYLSNSLLAGGLPNLRGCFVRYSEFPDLLLGLSAPQPGFASERRTLQRHVSHDSLRSPGFSSSSRAAMTSPNGLLSPNHMSNGFSASSSPRTPSQQLLSPTATASSMSSHRFSSNNPFANMVSSPSPTISSSAGLPKLLEVFTKGDDDLDWGMIKVAPGQASSVDATNSRPTSSYGLDSATQGWNAGGGARKSVLVADDDGGGFLAVPPGVGEGKRRGSTGGHVGRGRGQDTDEWPSFVRNDFASEKRSSRMDLWR